MEATRKLKYSNKPVVFLFLCLFGTISTGQISVTKKTPECNSVRFRVIADLDDAGVIPRGGSYSFLLEGLYIWTDDDENSTVGEAFFSENEDPTQNPDEPYALTKIFGNTSMEYSDLIEYANKTLTIDDESGDIYELVKNEDDVYFKFWAHSKNKLKAEWMTEKDGFLYVGAPGYPFFHDNGTIGHFKKMDVVVLDKNGIHVDTQNWTEKYYAIMRMTNCPLPGFIAHEAVYWSDIRKSWFVAPRKCTTSKYSDLTFDPLCCSSVFEFDESFKTMKRVIHFGKCVPGRGFSAIKPIPGTNDTRFISLLSSEIDNRTTTHLFAFDFMKRRPEYGPVLISNYKFEGISIIGE